MVDLEHSTHLTINRSSGVQTDSTNYHGQETRHTREGVNLLNEQINLIVRCCMYYTDPYSISVGKTAPKNAPFIVKRSDELPAGKKRFSSHNKRKR